MSTVTLYEVCIDSKVVRTVAHLRQAFDLALELAKAKWEHKGRWVQFGVRVATGGVGRYRDLMYGSIGFETETKKPGSVSGAPGQTDRRST